MKKIFFGILAMAAFAACSNEEQIAAPQGEAIAFGNAFVDNSVRAGEAVDPSYSANDIESFQVYGTVTGNQGPVVIYPGTIVSKDEAAYNSAWTCPVEQYWIPGAAYEFVGIVDGNKTVDGVVITETTLVAGMPTTIKYTADGATDLLCQTITKTAKTDGTSNGLVAFNFNHLLAKVKFTVANESATVTNYKYTVTGISVSNAYNSGVYNVSDEEWGSLASTTGQAFDSIVATAASTECANEKLLLPIAAPTVAYTVNLYYVENGEESLISSTPHTTTLTGYELEAGHAYNFKLTVKVGELIQFTVEEQPKWTNEDPKEL